MGIQIRRGNRKMKMQQYLTAQGVSLYATTKNSTTVYATNGAICVRCNFLNLWRHLTRVEYPSDGTREAETRPQPETTKLQYKKLGDSDLLTVEITLGTMIFGDKAHIRNHMICPLILLFWASTYSTPQKFTQYNPIRLEGGLIYM